MCVFFFWRIPDNLHWFWKLVGQMPGKFQTLAIEYIKRLVLLWKLTQNTTGLKLKDDVPFNRGWVLRLDATFWGSISTKKTWISESCKRNHGPRPYITWLNQHLCGCQKLPKIGRRVSSKRTKSPTPKRSNPTSYEFKEAKLSCQVFFKDLKFPTMVFQGAPHKTVVGSCKKNLPHFCREPMIWLHLFE